MADTQRRYFSGLARGLGPDTIGAPVDAAEQFINLLIAGVPTLELVNRLQSGMGAAARQPAK